MDGYDERTYGERFADVYDDWYDGITDAEACAAVVAGCAHDVAGAAGVLELGVGTGRLALPIAARGVAVVGVDASPRMLDVLAAKVAARPTAVEGGPTPGPIEGVLGDMVDPPVGEQRFAVVLVAYNTLFNLTAPGAQEACLARARALLVPGGCVVVEAFVPGGEPHLGPGPVDDVAIRTLTADRVVLGVSRTDHGAQEAMGQYVDLSEAGVRLRPWHVRWATPEQLDEVAARAALVLAERWAGWDRTPFDGGSRSHVSRYVAADQAAVPPPATSSPS